MSWWYEILVEGEEPRFFDKEGRKYYRWDGQFAPLYTTICFCSECRDFTQCEHIESAEETAELVQKLLSEPTVMGPRSRSSERLLENRAAWRAVRQSAAKCLTCGQSDFVELSHKPTWVPLLDRWVSLEFRGHLSGSFRRWTFYDAEGFLVPDSAMDQAMEEWERFKKQAEAEGELQ